MAREIPEAVRAVAGLAATVVDEARRLPDTLPGLPVRLLGLAMQVSMRLQQQYAGLVARGDELLIGLHGGEEPGLATFDEDEEQAVPEKVGTSAFDRVAETIIEVTDEGAPHEDVLDELAIEELVDAGGTAEAAAATGEVLAGEASGAVAAAAEDADGLPEQQVLAESPVLDAEAGGAAEVDVLAPGGGVETVEASVTDEGVAAPEAAEPAKAEPATTEPAVAQSLSAPAGPPVEGYDDWSIAQLRGRLRGYAPATVQELLDYEQGTRAREAYLRMLRNRLERLQSEA